MGDIPTMTSAVTTGAEASADPRLVTVITGAAGAIGSGLAHRLHERGDRLVLIDLNEELLHATWADTGHLLLGTDVTDADAMVSSADRVAATWQHVNHLVVNVGAVVEPLGGISGLDPETWRRSMQVNLDSAYYTIKAMLPLQLSAPGIRSIVIMSSVLGVRGSGHSIAYSSAKAGLLGLTSALAQDLATHDLTVNAVAPFLVAKPEVDALVGTGLDELSRRVPLGRVGTPEDIAAAVEFLTSSAARFSTGQTIVIDGGVSTGAWWHPYW